jgi:hypothetical protein
MPIPAGFDHQLGEIDNASSGILNRLRTMRHAADRDLPRMRARLRASAVMDTARDVGT